MLKLYNTAKKSLETFRPLGKNEVKVYTCGPTVYSFAHIGNLTSYIYWDFLLRVLRLNGFKTKRVLNLTDVGHLVSDGDEGEDKLEKGAKKEGKTVWEVAEFYISAFLKDFHALHLLEPDVLARATDYIEADKALVETLIEKGFTYETADGIYFDTSKFPTYADFAHLDLEGLKAGARVDFSSEKKNPSDFAVWKFIKDGENHAMRWDFLGRPGYPGWHLECSAIIHAELGETIDIHTGGIDHIPVHHSNEIAQSESAFGKKLANFWLHCDFINVDNQKISKSLGNIYTLADLAEKGFSPLDFKMWVLEGNYQTSHNFTFDGLTAAKNRRQNWRNKIATSRQLTSVKSIISAYDFSEKSVISALTEAVNNNLNSAAAFALVDQIPDFAPLSVWQFVDELFGLNLLSDSPDISDSQKQLLKDRELARAEKDFKKSDDLRVELEKSGITVKDTASGPIWQFIA